jgi:glutamate--cysteine ligase
LDRVAAAGFTACLSQIKRVAKACGKTHLMNQVFEQRLGALLARGDALVAGGRRGVEKESLRVSSDGYLAQTPHPQGLGSALTNHFITTDFSEALLEFVTPALGSTWEALQVICDIHQFTHRQLGDELLWCASMPCRLPADAEIPLARYGDSNIGRMKTIYRRGLGHRYGRNMQTIAGVHFNYSLPESFWPVYREVLGEDVDDSEFRSRHYLGLVRNFRRYGWIVLYLFGASPALCKSFGRGRDLSMPQLDDDTWYEPYGTSLRMSDLGYNNQTQAGISISLNALDEYIRDLSEAIRTPEPAYEKIGVIRNGEYQQLSANKLQIENEYYSPIRPKRVARSGERPTAALRRGGIEYVEIRSLDLNVSDPAGINQNTMRFIEAFLIYCLLEDSPPFEAESFAEAVQNQSLTAKRGREPGIRLQRDGQPLDLLAWAREIVAKVAAVAELVDRHEGDGSYREAVALAASQLADPDGLPSARLLQELRDSKSSFFEFALDLARRHRQYFASLAPMPPERARQLQTEAAESLRRQRDIEAADDLSFEEYLARYFATG